jgi:hypothetical protein
MRGGAVDLDKQRKVATIERTYERSCAAFREHYATALRLLEVELKMKLFIAQSNRDNAIKEVLEPRGVQILVRSSDGDSA